MLGLSWCYSLHYELHWSSMYLVFVMPLNYKTYLKMVKPTAFQGSVSKEFILASELNLVFYTNYYKCKCTFIFIKNV